MDGPNDGDCDGTLLGCSVGFVVLGETDGTSVGSEDAGEPVVGQHSP